MSAPTSEADLRKTKWFYRYAGILVALVFIGAAIVAGYTVWNNRSPSRTLHADGRSFRLEVASTTQAAALGLGDRPSLPKDHGMLFELSGDNSACFWMKDMNFPLDIIWFNAQKEIIYLQQNVTPDTYPHSYCPPEPAKYVIELNAGIAKSLGLETGQKLQF